MVAGTPHAIAPHCSKCGATTLARNEDDDLYCIACGWVDYPASTVPYTGNNRGWSKAWGGRHTHV